MSGDERSPGGIIIPGKPKVVNVSVVTRPIGGRTYRIPEDISVEFSVDPADISTTERTLSLLSSFLNQLGALVREVTRLREEAGLEPWGSGDEPERANVHELPKPREFMNALFGTPTDDSVDGGE